MKDKNYYSYARYDLLPFIKKGEWRVLDVGCAEGHFGAVLKSSGYARYVVGIEIDSYSAAQARSIYDYVVSADLNKQRPKEILGDSNKFDYIFCNDVLEHVIDPWQTLAELSSMLGEEGTVLVSVPNTRNYSVVLPLLLKGCWRYRDSGILDKTHLRFFTKKTACELVQKAELEIVLVSPLIAGKSKWLNRITFGLLEEFLAVQYVLVGKKNNRNG